jgi:hypothetical protein
MKAADLPVMSTGLMQCFMPFAANESSSITVMQPLLIGIVNAPLQKL